MMGPIVAIPETARRALLMATRCKADGFKFVEAGCYRIAARLIREANPAWWPTVEA